MFFGECLFLLHYWGIDVLGIVFLVRLFLLFLSALGIYYTTPFWSAMFLLINLLVVILGSPSYTVSIFLVFKIFSLSLILTVWLYISLWISSGSSYFLSAELLESECPDLRSFQLLFLQMSFLSLSFSFNFLRYNIVYHMYNVYTHYICIMSTYGVPYIH